MNARPEPFVLSTPDTAIADLHERLARTRFPDQAPGEPWAYGTSVEYVRGLAEVPGARSSTGARRKRG